MFDDDDKEDKLFVLGAIIISLTCLSMVFAILFIGALFGSTAGFGAAAIATFIMVIHFRLVAKKVKSQGNKHE